MLLLLMLLLVGESVQTKMSCEKTLSILEKCLCKGFNSNLKVKIKYKYLNTSARSGLYL